MRVPDMPTGWPSAIAPPLTLTLSSSRPSSRADGDADRGERLVELDQVEVGGRDALLLAGLRGRVWRAAAGGVESGPATMPCAPISASHSRPSSSAFALLITTTAAAPSEICEAEPAVIVPSLLNAGRSLPSDSAVVSPRTPSSWETTTGSPLRCGISTGTTSSSKTPFFQATAAFWCDCAANSSCSSRVRLCAAALHCSVEQAHRLRGELVEQRVVRHRVDER